MGLRPFVFGCMMLPKLTEAAMGGIGSGSRRSTRIGDVENALTLDIRMLRRLGVVRAGECVCDTVRWLINGLSAPSARLRIDLSDIERGGMMTISGDMPGGTISQCIAIDATPSAFGGWRCYFICPVTSRRCEILCYAGGRFASREAQRLSYAVQNMGDLSRARRKVAKLHRRLGGTDIRSRPRGSNRIEIVERLHVAERDAKTLYFDRLRSTSDRSATRVGPAPAR